MSSRHFHFALEFSPEALTDAVMHDVVTSILRHAGLSSANATDATVHVLGEAAAGGGARCRVQFEGGVDEVEILVIHDGTTTWRGVCPVE